MRGDNMADKRQRLIDERNKIKKTQEEVAQDLGITASYYGMIELGVRNPSLRLAKRMEEYFLVPMAELFFANIYNKELLERPGTGVV